jgi:hypothetical protein
MFQYETAFDPAQLAPRICPPGKKGDRDVAGFLSITGVKDIVVLILLRKHRTNPYFVRVIQLSQRKRNQVPLSPAKILVPLHLNPS